MYIVSVERRNGKVVIVDREGKEVCYNPVKLSEHGWCYLKDFPEKHEDEMKNKRDKWNKIPGWGICSEGCDTTLLKVRCMHKNKTKCQNKLSHMQYYAQDDTP